MTSLIYDCYYMTRMIKDKIYHRIFNYENKTSNVDRMNKSKGGIFTSSMYFITVSNKFTPFDFTFVIISW